jgi:hypothetical protein
MLLLLLRECFALDAQQRPLITQASAAAAAAADDDDDEILW